MAAQRRYSDEQLEHAVSAGTSWRGALRLLGLSATSASAIRSVRAHADRLGLDYGHFTGSRRWSDADLQEALVGATDWEDAARRLGLRGGSRVAVVKRHAARLGLDGGSSSSQRHVPAPPPAAPDLANLHRAGPQLAAAWYTLCGRDVCWPLEPCRYDLVVDVAGRTRRIQVKTTVTRAGSTWQVFLSSGGSDRKVYSPDEIDDFFLIDGDLQYYLVPIEAVRGMHAIHLSAYEDYRLPQLPAPDAT